MKKRLLYSCGAIILMASSLSAQKPGSLVGVVVDSLHGGGLEGAEITLSGTTLLTLTDSLGRFRFDSIPAGAHQVGVFHAFLDSLGISIATKPLSVGADSVAGVVLSVPSAETLIRKLCGTRSGDYGRGIVMGRILDPESGDPVKGSRVTVRWMNYEIEGKSLTQSPRALVAESDATGSFKLCGLPTDVSVRLNAARASISSPDLEVVIGSIPIVVTDVLVRSATSKAVGVVNGRVADSAGNGVAGARIEVQGSGLSAVTDAKGEFSINNVEQGTLVLLIRKLGYNPIAMPVNVRGNRALTVAYNMARYVPVLEEVRVRAQAEAGLVRVGFSQRARTGVGRYLKSEDIEKQGASRLSEVLRRVPGLAVDEENGQAYISSTRGANSIVDQGCVRLMLDGVEWRMFGAGDVDNIVHPSEIAGIEVYNPMAVPAEYSSMQGCTTILVWTKFKTRTR